MLNARLTTAVADIALGGGPLFRSSRAAAAAATTAASAVALSSLVASAQVLAAATVPASRGTSGVVADRLAVGAALQVLTVGEAEALV